MSRSSAARQTCAVQGQRVNTLPQRSCLAAGGGPEGAKYGTDIISRGINLYSSPDLATWTFEGEILNGDQIKGMPYPAPYRIERPKVRGCSLGSCLTSIYAALHSHCDPGADVLVCCHSLHFGLRRVGMSSQHSGVMALSGLCGRGRLLGALYELRKGAGGARRSCGTRRRSTTCCSSTATRGHLSTRRSASRVRRASRGPILGCAGHNMWGYCT